MNRADLFWALSAVIPHVGNRQGTTVGFTSHAGRLHVHACDGYTGGIARIDGPLNWQLALSKSEAVDLQRFIRPTLKAHHEHSLPWALPSNGDLHIGIEEDDSAVFETTEHDGLTLDALLIYMRHLAGSPVETAETVQQPPLLAKFSKAQRFETDRLRWYHYRPDSRPRGVSLVTVGSDFIGCIAGMNDDEQPGVTLASFLQNAEHDERVA